MGHNQRAAACSRRKTVYLRNKAPPAEACKALYSGAAVIPDFDLKIIIHIQKYGKSLLPTRVLFFI